MTRQDDDRYPATARTTPTRYRERARYDRAAVHAVLDEALVCHVGYDDGGPVVLPTIHTRLGDALYLHGSTGSRLSRLAARPGGVPLCVTVTLLDGLVLARSWFNHSMNYRSVVARGTGELVTDPDEKDAAFRAVVEHVVAGRTAGARPPTPKELAATGLVRLPLVEVSLKERGAPPADDEADLGLPHWAGVIGVRQAFGPVEPDPGLPAGAPVPAHVSDHHRPGGPR